MNQGCDRVQTNPGEHPGETAIPALAEAPTLKTQSETTSGTIYPPTANDVSIDEQRLCRLQNTEDFKKENQIQLKLS